VNQTDFKVSRYNSSGLHLRTVHIPISTNHVVQIFMC